MSKRPPHRPQRSFPDAERVIIECELDACVHCGEALVPSGTWHVRKYVQTMKGPLFVAGKSMICDAPDCSHHNQHYHASGVLHISLPKSTYGLDVLAFIGWQHEHEHKQFVEIQERLKQRGIEVSERHVGRLYRQFLALLGGMDGVVRKELERTAEKHGGLIWGIDALQPEGSGTLLYVLYEVLSGTPVAGAQLDHPTADDLIEWLKPYQALPYKALATLSDGEGAIIVALETCWPDAPRQRCQEHFLGNLAEPVLDKVDGKLRKWLRNGLGGLPAVPSKPETPVAETDSSDNSTPCNHPLIPSKPEIPVAETDSSDSIPCDHPLVPSEPEIPVAETDSSDSTPCDHPLVPGESETPSVETDNGDSISCGSPLVPSEPETPVAETNGGQATPAPPFLPATQAQRDQKLVEIETQVRVAIRDAVNRKSRKPFYWGGLKGYEQLEAIAQALGEMPYDEPETNYLRQLQTRVDQVLERFRVNAEDLREAHTWLRKIAACLRYPPSENAPDPVLTSAQVQQEMDELLQSFQPDLKRKRAQAALHGAWQRTWEDYGPDLLHCYDIPGLPPDNLRLEALFGRHRRHQRRVSGRKSTRERSAELTSKPARLWAIPASIYR